MKAAQLISPNTLKYHEVPEPKVGPNDVLIKTERVGICGTDLELFKGTMPFFKTGLSKYPIIPGHEWCGRVVEVGSAVQGFAPGDRVTGDVSVGCGTCPYCMEGLYHLCLHRAEVGISGGKDGACSEVFTMPYKHVFKVPESLSPEIAAVTEPTATVIKAIDRAPLRLGAIVLVLGDGPIGLLALQAANCAGSAFTMVSGTSDEKLKVARELGADLTINITRESLREAVMDHTRGLGADYVMECSGKAACFHEAVELVRPSGTICGIGICEHNLNNYDIARVVCQDITFVGTVASPNAFPRTIRLLASGRIKPHPLITHRMPLVEMAEAMNVMQEKADKRIKIMLSAD